MKAAFVLLAVVVLVATTQANHAAGVQPSDYSLIGSVLSHLENNSGCSFSDLEALIENFASAVMKDITNEIPDFKNVLECLRNPSVTNCIADVQSFLKIVKLIQIVFNQTVQLLHNLVNCLHRL